jgi:23S rRNA (adenine1618-N6)-methyltransferase
MSTKQKSTLKSRLHPRNLNRERYDLKALLEVEPSLSDFVIPNRNGEDSIDFAQPKAVKTLNKALLKQYYGLEFWDFPDENLCPPIPGRADYLHYMADLLSQNNYGRIPKGDQITGLDIGVGASAIYPILGVCAYDWQFIGSDIDPKSIASAQKIIEANTVLQSKIACRLQQNPKDVLFGILDKSEKVDFTLCNPPFHASVAEAQEAARRKEKNLSGKKEQTPTLNFAGIHHELIYEGGEYKFIRNLVRESSKFAQNCLWFSTLVSKQSNVKGVTKYLDKLKARAVKVIPIGTGNKATRIVAWSFLTEAQQKDWQKSRWK